MNTVTSHQDAIAFEDHLNKRTEAKEFYNSYQREKSFLFRHSISIIVFLIFIVPVTLALYFASLKPLTLSILFMFAYFIVCARISDDLEKSFQKDFPNFALLIFPK